MDCGGGCGVTEKEWRRVESSLGIFGVQGVSTWDGMTDAWHGGGKW